SHSHTRGKPPVVRPSDKIIDEIRALSNRINSPKKASDLFLVDVTHFNYDDSLAKLLQSVNITQYSQSPVVEDTHLKGLITENAITQFLSRSVKDDLISIKETNISDVINLDEAKDSWEIVNSNTLLIDVKEIFNKKLNAGNSLF